MTLAEWAAREITWDRCKDVVLLGLFLWTHRSVSGQVKHNTALTRKVGIAVDAGNDLTEAIAKKEGSLPPVPDGSMRPRAITLEDLAEAVSERHNKKGG